MRFWNIKAHIDSKRIIGYLFLYIKQPNMKNNESSSLIINKNIIKLQIGHFISFYLQYTQ